MGFRLRNGVFKDNNIIMRLSLDELRDMVGHLKKGAESLYRYGDVGHSKTLFNRLSESDQKRLLYLALLENDKDITNVATNLMQKLTPPLKDLEDLLAHMDTTDKAEVERLQMQLKQDETELSDADRQRIMDILSESCDKMGSLSYEEAFWVLIPSDPEENIAWIQASGKGEQDYTHVRLPSQVQYVPDKDELHRLLDAMRSSLWVLHIHNHPQSAEETVCYGASPSDGGLANHWKHLRPELTAKMKFFIIHRNTAFEYSENLSHAVQWLGEKIETKPLSEKEYYEKQFPLDVAKRIAKEKRKKMIDEMFGEN